MKKQCLYLLCVLCVFPGVSYAQEQSGKNRFQQAVEDQRQGDLKRKNDLVAKMKGIIGGFNTRLKRSGIRGRGCQCLVILLLSIRYRWSSSVVC
ncbi:MAG: hypothetical protein ACRCUT_06315, partial [Spirochaetota bacterium]